MDINPFVEAIDRQKLGVEGIELVRRGQRIARYRWVPETPRPVYSVSKSVTAIAVGMAIDAGKLSLGDRVMDAFPIPHAEVRLRALTLEHCLTMSRGHGTFSRPQSVAEALAQPLIWDPGSRFVYDNGSAFLASAMLTQAVGMNLRTYLLDRLFRPLGIPDPVWAESADGHTLGATGLELSTGSLARFGQFLIQRGCWQGTQLVSSRWIDEATRLHISVDPETPGDDAHRGYGYLFWLYEHGAYRGEGKWGQYVVVMPAQETVAAISSQEPHMDLILQTLWDHILLPLYLSADS